jgi:PTS system mannose-specific IID component
MREKVPLLPIFLRSFFFQALWNYPRMQGIGFLFTILPAARRLFPDRTARIQFMRRHSCFFNTQPYCSSVAVGLILRGEEGLSCATQTPSTREDSGSRIGAEQELLRLKDSLCGPLGLIGDQVFWQLLKPIAAAAGMAAAMLAGGYGRTPALLGAAMMLLLFNPLHIWMRWWGLKTGFHYDADQTRRIVGRRLSYLRDLLSQFGFYLAFVLIVIAFTFVRIHFDVSGRSGIQPAWVSFLIGFAAMNSLLRLRVSLPVTLLVILLLGLIPALFFDPGAQ